MLSGASSGADSGVAEYGDRDLTDRALLDEFFRAERFGAEFLLGPGYESHYRQGGATGIEEVIVTGGHGQPQLSADVDNPLFDGCLAVRATRLTHLLTYGETETIDGTVDEPVVVEPVFASYEHVAESLEASRTAELLKRVRERIDAY